jgi:hypothetical protein
MWLCTKRVIILTNDLFIAFLHHLRALNRGPYLFGLGRAAYLNFLRYNRLRSECGDGNLGIGRNLDTLDAIGIYQLHLMN